MFVECAGVPDRLWAVALTICGDFSDPYLTTYYDPDAEHVVACILLDACNVLGSFSPGSSLYAIL